MSDVIFVGQELELTLTCKDNDGTVLDLSGKTPHFLIRDPSGNVTTDTSPTVGSTAGTVMHAFSTGDIDEQGTWQNKVMLSTNDIPSTRYTFTAYSIWGK